jgi:heavy metal sensor kinase
MKFFHSIRWRLQFWYGLLVVAVLSGFGITAYQLESSRQFRRLDEELRRRLPALVESQRPVPSDRTMREFNLLPRHAPLFDDSGEGFYYVVWLRHSERPVTFSPGAPRDVPQPKADESPVRQREHLREVFLFPGPGDCVLVGRSIAADAASLRQLAWWLSGVGVAVLVLGLAVGAWLVRRALRPIKDISSAASKIATGNLTQRIDTRDSESELGQLASVLNSTFARLDAAFTQQARFTADAAHELRTPVSVMLTHAQNGLASECANEEHHEAFEATQRAAQRMRRLIDSLLELARLDAGQEALRRDECDLGRIAAESLELIQPLAEKRSIRIQTDFAPTPCQGDADRLGQVITNLLTNAIDYNQDGGEVRISTRRSGSTATLTVWNTGPGILAEDLPHIFERFHRADKSRSGTGHSGLGLAIAKAIVQAHGGNITALSESKTGTCFTVILPA